MSNTKKLVLTTLFFGGLWGTAEATLGYLLHLLPSGFSGSIMFPIGLYMMINAQRVSGSRMAIPITAVVAAIIKMSDFFLPTRSAMSVLNPATSIILESLVVVAFANILNGKKIIAKSALIGLSWTVVFTIAQALIFKPVDGLYTYPIIEMLSIIAFNTIVSGSLIAIYLNYKSRIKTVNLQRFSYVQPAILIALGIAFELINSII